MEISKVYDVCYGEGYLRKTKNLGLSGIRYHYIDNFFVQYINFKVKVNIEQSELEEQQNVTP